MGQTRASRPWDPAPDESASAYAAFCVYRELGIGRSIADVLRTLEQMGEKVARDSVYGWSNKFNWDERVLKWEKDLQNQRSELEVKEARRSAIKLQREKEKRIEVNLLCANELRVKALEMMNYPLEKCVKTSTEKDKDGNTIAVHKHYEPVKWSMRDASIMIRVAMEIEKLALFKDESNSLDTSQETLAEAQDRLSTWRSEMTAAIEGFSDVAPGSIANPLDGGGNGD